MMAPAHISLRFRMPHYIVPPECKPAVYRNGEFYKVGETFTVHTEQDLHIKFVPADAEAYDFSVKKFGAAVVEKKHGLLFGAEHVDAPPPPKPPAPLKVPVPLDDTANLRQMMEREAAVVSFEAKPEPSAAQPEPPAQPTPPSKKRRSRR